MKEKTLDSIESLLDGIEVLVRELQEEEGLDRLGALSYLQGMLDYYLQQEIEG